MLGVATILILCRESGTQTTTQISFKFFDYKWVIERIAGDLSESADKMPSSSIGRSRTLQRFMIALLGVK
jgi:hypothetical protein